jgi:hypothetical protein
VTQIIDFWISQLVDDYILSWINTVLYGCSFVAAIYKWNNLRHTQTPLREQHLWLFLIFIILALGVNKQFDFQTLLFEVGRHVAKYEGWFEKRRLVQSWFAYVLSGIVGCGALLILVSTRKLWRHNALALIGLSILCVYTVIRTTSINHVDIVARSRSEGEFRFTDIIEFFGILGILVNAITRYSGEKS